MKGWRRKLLIRRIWLSMAWICSGLYRALSRWKQTLRTLLRRCECSSIIFPQGWFFTAPPPSSKPSSTHPSSSKELLKRVPLYSSPPNLRTSSTWSTPTWAVPRNFISSVRISWNLRWLTCCLSRSKPGIWRILKWRQKEMILMELRTFPLHCLSQIGWGLLGFLLVRCTVLTRYRAGYGVWLFR